MENHVPHSLSFGLHPHVIRPKGQGFRVEHGVAVERATNVTVTPGDVSAAAVGALIETAAPAALSGSTKLTAAEATGVLAFGAWFAEAVAESGKETARIRKVVITYHLEDGTLAVIEPPVANSGLPQSKVLSRHQVPRAATRDGSVMTAPGGRHSDFLSWKDLRVGGQLLLYGKMYTLYSCNEFTRRWYAARDAAAGGEGLLEQVPDEDAPADRYTSERTAAMLRETGAAHDVYRGRKMSPVKRYMEASRGSSSAIITRGVKDTTEQWRTYDSRAVLRFYGLIDETAAPGGHKVKFRVHFYQADDCMELIQMRYPNDGMDRFSIMWRRARLPKTVIYHDSRGRDIESDKGDADYYGLDDLAVGKTIDVMGRKVLLFDADTATHEWYLANRGLDMKAAVVDVSDAPVTAPAVPLPPYLGYGTEEDSLGSFFSLQPRRPRKNWAKIRLFEDMILRFHAKFANPTCIPDSERDFTVSFFPDTDSLAIYEPPVKNSGGPGGKFLAKTRMRDVGSGRYFEPGDFFAGAVINVNGFLFRLGAADKATEELLLKLGDGDSEAASGTSGAGSAVLSAPSGRVQALH